jgi:beta-mannosidase
MAQSHTIQLVAEGVDTIATIVINGQSVGSTNNMFVKYIFDITDVVHVSSKILIS